MSNIQESFLDSEESSECRSGTSFEWRFATNHQNLMYMLAAGLFLPSKGFGKKYYQDTLSLVDGWIPFFPSSVPAEVIEHCTSESKILRPSIVEVDLSKTSGVFPALKGGSWVQLDFIQDDFSDVDCILMPAPLPLSIIKEIKFRSPAEVKEFKKGEKDFGNVPLEDFKLKSKGPDFKKKGIAWPPTHKGVGARETDTNFVDSVGGAIAALNVLANTCEPAILALKSLKSDDADAGIDDAGAILGLFGAWANSDVVNRDLGTAARIFWSIASSLAVN